MSGQNIIVIGAGIAGLVAARRLTKAGHRVRVLEAGELPGGRVGERDVRGIRFNAGARLLYAFSRPFNALLAEIGLSAALIPVRSLSADCAGRDGNWSVELMPGVKSLFTPGLSVAERLRFIAFGAKVLAGRRHTDPDDAASALQGDGETLADYVRRVFGSSVLERMVEPVFRGTRNWRVDEASAAFFASVTPHLVGHDTVHVLAGGMSKLPQALAEGLALETGTQVVLVETPPTGTARVHAKRSGETITYEADLVVCATEGVRAASLFPQLSQEDQSFFASVRYNALGIVHYRLDQQIAPAMSFFSRDVAGPIATWQQVPGNEKTGQAPQLYAQMSPEAVDHAVRENMTEKIDAIVRDRVRELYPTLDRDCTDLHNQWIPHMLPLFYPGYARGMAAFRDKQSAARRQIYFCGDYLAQSLVTGAAASGERAASDILRHWS